MTVPVPWFWDEALAGHSWVWGAAVRWLKNWSRCLVSSRESGQYTARTMSLMDEGSKVRHPKLRARWAWLGGGIGAVALVVTGVAVVPQILDRDPCSRALSFATDLGLQLSSDDEVVSCDWHTSFPDSSGTVMVRTASDATRKALLERSGVSEETYRWAVSVDDGPAREEVHRPNLQRSEQVYEATAPNGHQLRISYDEGVESGLLLAVSALET